MSEPVIEIKGLQNTLGGLCVHSNVNLTVNKGEILAIIGGSGSGKTTLLRSILMLLKPKAGVIRVFGQDLSQLSEAQETRLRRRWGMLFQHSALFSAMTVLDNVMFPMRELSNMDPLFMHQLAMLKIALVGLPNEAANKFPSELSGGMKRRAAAARAIAMDPELLLLDEPTSGLDPHGAKQFDQLIIFLRDVLNLTIVIVSHDVDSLQRTTDRVAFIGAGEVLRVAPLAELKLDPHPLIVDYFSKLNPLEKE